MTVVYIPSVFKVSAGMLGCVKRTLVVDPCFGVVLIGVCVSAGLK